MGRKDQGLIRQAKKLPRDRVKLFPRVPTGEIRPSSAPDEEGIACEYAVSGVETHAVGRMTRRIEYLQLNVSDGMPLPVFNVDVYVGSRCPAVHDHFGTRQAIELEAGGTMVGVGVGVDDGVESTAIVCKRCKITIDLFLHGINQGSLVGVLTGDEVSFTLAVVEFTEKHGDPSYL